MVLHPHSCFLSLHLVLFKTLVVKDWVVLQPVDDVFLLFVIEDVGPFVWSSSPADCSLCCRSSAHGFLSCVCIPSSVPSSSTSTSTSDGPRQANLVLIAYASSEGSGEPEHPRSLARTSLLAHTSSESRGTFRQKARSLGFLNGWACAVTICHGGMLEDTNSLDAAQMVPV